MVAWPGVMLILPLVLVHDAEMPWKGASPVRVKVPSLVSVPVRPVMLRVGVTLLTAVGCLHVVRIGTLSCRATMIVLSGAHGKGLL